LVLPLTTNTFLYIMYLGTKVSRYIVLEICISGRREYFKYVVFKIFKKLTTMKLGLHLWFLGVNDLMYLYHVCKIFKYHTYFYIICICEC
jgi:hypothetical protein